MNRAAPDKRGAIVLGCGRSGTSAVTRSMVTAGFFAGADEELLGAAESNKTGHFEPIPVLELDEDLLRAHGSRWWAEVPDEATAEPARAAAAPRIEAVLADLLAGADGAPIAVKEPRINGLLDLWGPLVEDLLHPVLVIRNPLEVAHSLVRRDGNSVVNALAAWEVQSTGALRWLDGRVATVAHYAELNHSGEAITAMIEDVAAHLEPALATRVDATPARDALDPKLRNEDAAGIDLSEHLTGRQQRLWDFLRKLPAGSARLAVPEELRREPAAARASVRSEGDRQQLLAELVAAREDGGRLTERVAALEAERDEAVAARDRAHVERDEAFASRDRMAAERDRLAAEKDAALRRADEAESKLERVRPELAESQRAVEDLLQSSSWRMTRPLRALKRDVEAVRRPRRKSG